jgi:hypothetical protein
MRHSLYGYLFLISPPRVLRNLERAIAAGVTTARPNTWQLCLGVIRLWHRLVFRTETIGTSSGPPPRRTWRARLLENRALRLPALLVEGAVAPWDFTGLYSDPARIIRHLLAAHHDKNQFVFDLQILAGHEGRIDELITRCQAVVAGAHPRSEWLRDLVVYEGYHESLLEAAGAAARGDFRLEESELADPDLSLSGLLRWCAGAPPTPAATLEAWRRRDFQLGPAAVEVAA